MDYTGVVDLLKNDLIDLFLDFLFQDIGLYKDPIESDFLFQDIGLSKDLIESFRRHLENSEMLNVDFSIQVKLFLLNTVVSIYINTVLLKLGYNYSSR